MMQSKATNFGILVKRLHDRIEGRKSKEDNRKVLSNSHVKKRFNTYLDTFLAFIISQHSEYGCYKKSVPSLILFLSEQSSS